MNKSLCNKCRHLVTWYMKYNIGEWSILGDSHKSLFKVKNVSVDGYCKLATI